MRKENISLKGVFPPVPTPFDESQDVAASAMISNIERLNGFDLAGCVILGSNGEAIYLGEDEKVEVLTAARRAIPLDKLFIAGTGCESTRATIALTRSAAEIGADAALVLSPHYYKGGMTDVALTEYYVTVADSSPIPIIIYNVPKFTGLDMSAATIVSIAGHPNVIGVKDSSGNIAKIGDIVRLKPAHFQVLVGTASAFLAALALGAIGGVLALSNIAPVECLEIYKLFLEGDLDRAAELQRRMLPVNSAVTARFGIAGLKAAMDMFGYKGGHCRLPLQDLVDSDRRALQIILNNAGVLNS